MRKSAMNIIAYQQVVLGVGRAAGTPRRAPGENGKNERFNNSFAAPGARANAMTNVMK